MMDYILQNMQYRYMENVIQQINRGAVQNVTKPSLSGTGFAHIFQQTQMAESGISAGDLDAIFEEASRTYGVPADLLKAVGKMESNFDPYAQSGAGAQGVMQLMPSTAQSLGVTDPFDARSNIMGGAKYLSDLLARYDGNVDLALAAYNAGSGNVEKYGGVPPFQETQNYISRVKEYMGDAGNLLTGGSGSVRNVSGKTGVNLCPLCGEGKQVTDTSGEMLTLLSELFKVQIQRQMISSDDFTGTFV